MKYSDFDNLPPGLKKRIKNLHPRDYKDWVNESIPALYNRSILRVMNSDDGLAIVSQYLKKVESYLGE